MSQRKANESYTILKSSSNRVDLYRNFHILLAEKYQNCGLKKSRLTRPQVDSEKLKGRKCRCFENLLQIDRFLNSSLLLGVDVVLKVIFSLCENDFRENNIECVYSLTRVSIDLFVNVAVDSKRAFEKKDI